MPRATLTHHTTFLMALARPPTTACRLPTHLAGLDGRCVDFFFRSPYKQHYCGFNLTWCGCVRSPRLTFQPDFLNNTTSSTVWRRFIQPDHHNPRADLDPFLFSPGSDVFVRVIFTTTHLDGHLVLQPVPTLCPVYSNLTYLTTQTPSQCLVFHGLGGGHSQLNRPRTDIPRTRQDGTFQTVGLDRLDRHVLHTCVRFCFCISWWILSSLFPAFYILLLASQTFSPNNVFLVLWLFQHFCAFPPSGVELCLCCVSSCSPNFCFFQQFWDILLLIQFLYRWTNICIFGRCTFFIFF